MGRQFARISSGLRVNSAADDAAGLSISMRLEAQGRGYKQTVKNATDAISLGQTIDGAYQQTTANLQRMRELVVQAGNETLNDQDRASIRQELEELKNELDSIGTLEFNGGALFGGHFDFHLAVDSSLDTNLSLSTHKLAADRLGHQVVTQSALSVDPLVALADQGLSFTNSEGETTLVRGSVASDDELSTVQSAGSAIAKAAAINSSSHIHGVTARALSTVITGGATQATSLNEASYIKINGEAISGFEVTENDADGALASAINAVSDKTGVIASYSASGQLILTAEDGRNVQVEVIGAASAVGLNNTTAGGGLELQSLDTFQMSVSSSSMNNALGQFFGTTTLATYGIADGSRSLTGQDGVSGVDPDLNTNFALDGVSPLGQVTFVTGNEATDVNLKSTGNIISFEDKVSPTAPRTMELNHQLQAGNTVNVTLNIVSGNLVGGTSPRVETSANDSFENPDGGNESLILQSSTDGVIWVTAGTFTSAGTNSPTTENLGDSEAKRLEDGAVTLSVTNPSADFYVRIAQLSNSGNTSNQYDHYGIVAGEVEVTGSVLTGVFGSNYDASVETISVASKEDADRALQIIDVAIGEVISAQGEIGALQNRLEAAVSQMEQAKESVLSAKSRIMDADFAVESATLAQQQIIQQAGVSVLAQANQQPSVALSLIA